MSVASKIILIAITSVSMSFDSVIVVRVFYIESGEGESAMFDVYRLTFSSVSLDDYRSLAGEILANANEIAVRR